MPPVFGILNTHLQSPDSGMIFRMNSVAGYIKPSKVEAVEMAGGYMAVAIPHEHALVSKGDAMTLMGQMAIVADVSLYKRKELLKLLGIDASQSNVSDAVLILWSYLKWGHTCLKYLYGDFAFVIFNLQTGTVFCGRDPLGVRPLFYAFEQDVFVFGSELRYVVASFKSRPAIRNEYLLDTLVTVKSEKELSSYEHIFRLKPGHYLDCQGGVINIHQYWQVDIQKAIRFSNEAEYVELFREKLVKAVNMRCKGIPHLGAELSGGLDSSAVTGIAADCANREGASFAAFSNIFPAGTGIEFKDEREFINAMRKFKPFDWIGIDRLNQSIPELLQHTVDIQGCFIQQNFSIFNRGVYEAAGDREVQVLLSGFGGDELVSARIATPWNEIIRERQWKILSDELFYSGVSVKALLKMIPITARYLKSQLYHPEYRTGVFTTTLLNRRFANLLLKSAFAEEYALRKRMGDKYKKIWHEQTAWRQYDRIMQDHLPQRMEYCYTAAAQYGLEYRYPLLDVDLVETCLAFPPWVKQHQGRNRHLFRQAIKAFVPEEIWQRNDKSGSTIPHSYYSLLKEKELILGLVNSGSGSAFLKEIFDLSLFAPWYERLVKRDKADMNYLMPGAFYNYLMIMLYYRDKGQVKSNE